jgi:predicted flap endonuclease-1-like 5' DNA nuclease
MSNFACCLWWLVAGVLIGWLLAWLFDRFFRRDGEAAGVRYRSEIEGLNGRIAELTSRLSDAEGRAKNADAIAAASSGMASAAAFGFAAQRNGRDNLELIEGIGPKISELLQQSGIDTFARLASTPAAAIQRILDAAGPNFRLANPVSWPGQAALCIKGDWSALRKLQDVLVAGVDPNTKRDE